MSLGRKQRIAVDRGDKAFYAVITGLLTLFVALVLYPILHVVAASFSDGNAISTGRVRLWPVGFSLDGYRAVIGYRDFSRSYVNTIVYTLSGTLINVIMAMITAYPLSRRDLVGRNAIMAVLTLRCILAAG